MKRPSYWQHCTLWHQRGCWRRVRGIPAFFDHAGLPGRSEDEALLTRVAMRAGAQV